MRKKLLISCRAEDFGARGYNGSLGMIHTEVFLYDGQKIEEKKYTKWLDYDRIIKYPCIRTRKTGDYIVINSKGDRKKINRCMIDEKIPADRRDQVPLIAVRMKYFGS